MTETSVERSTLVIDMADFTKNTIEQRDKFVLGNIKKLRDISLRTITELNGQIVKFDADNVFALFPDPEKALKAVLDISDKLKGSPAICVGIGHGTLIQWDDDGDYYGLQINLASRLGEDLAGPGEILLTETAYERLSPSLKSLFQGPLEFIVGGHPFSYYRYRIR